MFFRELKHAPLRSDVSSAAWLETRCSVKCVLQMLGIYYLVIFLQTYTYFSMSYFHLLSFTVLFFIKYLFDTCWQFHRLLMWLIIDMETEKLAFFSCLPTFSRSLQIKCRSACFLLSVSCTVDLPFTDVLVSKVCLHSLYAHVKAIIGRLPLPQGVLPAAAK